MRPTKVLWRFFGSIVALAVVVWAVFGVVSLVDRHAVRLDLQVDAANIATIDVAVHSADVDIVGIEGSKIAIRGELVSSFSETPHVERQDGPRFIVSNSCGSFGAQVAQCSGNYRIEVPRGIEVRFRAKNSSVELARLDGTVDLRTTNNRVVARDLSGPTTLVTSNGRLDLNGITGPLSATTSNSRITASGLGASPVELFTSNGSIEAAFAQPPSDVIARTSNGSLSVVVPESDRAFDVDAYTSNGDRTVNIRTAPDSPYKISAGTSNDDVSVTYRKNR